MSGLIKPKSTLATGAFSALAIVDGELMQVRKTIFGMVEIKWCTGNTSYPMAVTGDSKLQKAFAQIGLTFRTEPNADTEWVVITVNPHTSMVRGNIFLIVLRIIRHLERMG